MSEHVSTTRPREELASMREQNYKDPRPAEYFDRYAVVAWVTEAEVARPSKF